MANLDYIEKNYFNKLFEKPKGPGYVLDLSNHKFQQFVYSIMKIDIYRKYGNNISKGKILNKIMDDYDNVSVGKLLLQLLRYMQANNMLSNEDSDLFKKCAEIGNRLIGKKISTASTPATTTSTKSVIDHSRFLNELKDLSNLDDTPQARGYAFEKYLKNLFEAHGLEPRGSFKIAGEQIDGSFILHNEIYLLEAKWTNKKIDKTSLVGFNEKVLSKSGFTRGLYISFSNYTNEALTTFATGRTVNIVLMTVQELAISLSRELNLTHVLSHKVRALAEEGNFNKSVFEI